MTGPIDSVIGFAPETVLPRFLTGLPTRFEVAQRARRGQRPAHRHRPGEGAGHRRGAHQPHGRRVTTLRRNRVDLHTHTSRSDGVLPPLELYGRCAPRARPWSPSPTTTRSRAPRAARGRVRRASDAPQVITGIEINTVDADLRRWRTDCPTARSCTSWATASIPRMPARGRAGRAAGGSTDRIALTLARLDELGMPVT